MPWEALGGDLEASVRVSLLRSAHGPPFYVGMAGDASAHEVMDAMLEQADVELQSRANYGWQQDGRTCKHPDKDVWPISCPGTSYICSLSTPWHFMAII
jgi:hypothetical protein